MVGPAIEALPAMRKAAMAFGRQKVRRRRFALTMMIFSQGQVAATKVGALPKSKIKEWIESAI